MVPSLCGEFSRLFSSGACARLNDAFSVEKTKKNKKDFSENTGTTKWSFATYYFFMIHEKIRQNKEPFNSFFHFQVRLLADNMCVYYNSSLNQFLNCVVRITLLFLPFVAITHPS